MPIKRVEKVNISLMTKVNFSLMTIMSQFVATFAQWITQFLYASLHFCLDPLISYLLLIICPTRKLNTNNYGQTTISMTSRFFTV